MSDKLIFVYNANSGLGNSLVDIAHKALSPSTYSCNLCDITHGIFGERKQWKAFRKVSGWDMEFLHKDEFEQQYKMKNGKLEWPQMYPMVFLSRASKLEELITTGELNALPDAESLIEVLHQRLVIV